MRRTVSVLFILIIITNVLGQLTVEKDIFNLYKDTVDEVKQLTNSVVTRDKITFHMYRNYLEPKDVILEDQNLNVLEGTKGYIVFISHGWTDSGDSDWILELKDNFLYTYPDAVVISVDWREPARQPYSISALNVYDVGNFIGNTIINLINNHRLKPSQFIVTGHSLGGHISGFAGKRVQTVGIKIGRIVALDPAGPEFDIRPFDKRLNPTDAEIVEVIHTDSGNYGLKLPCGTIDFYPNGGNLQPGCTRVDVLDIRSITDPVTCDHGRAYDYFIEAVRNPGNFVAKRCTEWNILRKICNDSITVPMGDLSTTLTGNFYFETNKEKPYSKKTVTEKIGILDYGTKFFSVFNIFNKD